MYRKGSPIALIRATDHRRRQADKANFSLCPTKVARRSLTVPAVRRLLAWHRASLSRAPPEPRCCHRQRQSEQGKHDPPLAVPCQPGGTVPTAVRAPGPAMLRGRAQVRTPPGVGHEVALSARRCRRRRELSKVKVTNRLFPPQGQGFGPSPSCHQHAASPAASPCGLGRPGSVPPAQGRAPGLHFPAGAAALRSSHPALPPPAPSAAAKTTV